MKLRIKGNSLRLRVSRSEVASLLRRERLEETIHFAPQANAKLTYALEQSASVSALTLQYIQNNVTILMPADQANTWCDSDQVGIVENVDLGNFGILGVLIEKDFACLDRNDEENEDMFSNPHAGSTCVDEGTATTVFPTHSQNKGR